MEKAATTRDTAPVAVDAAGALVLAPAVPAKARSPRCRILFIAVLLLLTVGLTGALLRFRAAIAQSVS